ncbi:MAG: hypothetical protein N3A65_09660 [candidate division WOR-3 bacterium]|nr:hypothetical protein [candidate division WOR-3 bacterium]
MRDFLKILIFLILLIVYFLNNPRRVYLKKRLKKGINLNIKKTAENISLMLIPKDEIRLKGNIEALKKGAILYSIHFGTWELLPRIMQKFLNKEIGILVNRYTRNNVYLIGRLMDNLFYHFRTRYNSKIFYPDEVFRIVSFIKKGGIFSVLVDGDNFYSKFEKIKKLARICNAPLIPFAIYYENGLHVIELDCDFERLLKRRTHDYWWFYKSRRH